MPESEASKPKFDAYARSDELHQQVVARSGEDSEYFTLYKLECFDAQHLAAFRALRLRHLGDPSRG